MATERKAAGSGAKGRNLHAHGHVPLTDTPTQAVESGDPRLTGRRSAASKGSGAAKRQFRDRGNPQDFPGQAWESGRSDAIP